MSAQHLWWQRENGRRKPSETIVGCKRCGVVTGRNTWASGCTHRAASSGTAPGDAGLEGWCLPTARAGRTPQHQQSLRLRCPLCTCGSWAEGGAHQIWHTIPGEASSLLWKLALIFTDYLPEITSLKLVSYTLESLVWKRHYKLRACWEKKKKRNIGEKKFHAKTNIYLYIWEISPTRPTSNNRQKNIRRQIWNAIFTDLHYAQKCCFAKSD